MKKYICLLLILLFPIIVFADCDSEIQERIDRLEYNYNIYFVQPNNYNCNQLTSRPQNGHPCQQSFSGFENTLYNAVLTYNQCSTNPRAEELYNTYLRWLHTYNSLPSHPNFSVNKTEAYPCSKALKSSLESIELKLTTVKSVCDSTYGTHECPIAVGALRNLFDTAKVNMVTYKKDWCDIKEYEKDVKKIIDQFNNAFPSYAYDYETGYDSCYTEAANVIEKINEAKDDIVSRSCNIGAEVNNECKSYIKAYKEMLDKAFDKADKELTSCRSISHFDDDMETFIKWYDNIPYVRENGQPYEEIRRQQKEIKKEAVFCPLGSDVTEDLVGVLRIMKIAAPILVLVLTAYEVIKNVMEGEIEAKSKELFKKFGKRCFGALLLFAIPVLIDIFMQLLNVWDETGRCVLTESETRYEERKTSSKEIVFDDETSTQTRSTSSSTSTYQDGL